MSTIMTAVGAILGFLTVSPAGGTIETIGSTLGAACAGWMLWVGFDDARTRSRGTGWLGSPWSGKKRYFLISGGSAVFGYFASTQRDPDSPDLALLSAWCVAGICAFCLAGVVKQLVDKPIHDRQDQRIRQRWKLHNEMENFVQYLGRWLGRRGLWLVCSGGGFNATDYRWWCANDAEYGWTAHRRHDGLIAGNWRIKYAGGDTVRTVFAGRSQKAKPGSIAEYRYFQIQPPSDYQLAERLYLFLEVQRNWTIPSKSRGGEPDLAALATIITCIIPADVESARKRSGSADASAPTSTARALKVPQSS